MSVLCNRCNPLKVHRPEKCAVSGGQPCAACAEDIELENEITRLEAVLEKIHTRRRALRTIMNENHDRLIYAFPPEITSHIFFQYASPSACFDDIGRTNPLHLGAVCRQWRKLAWATPQLWSSLAVQVQRTSKGSLIQFLTEWLERSADVPLTIKLDLYWQQGDRDGVFVEAINVLNKHSARWYDMEFNLPARHLHRLCGSSQETILRRLVLSCPSLISLPPPSDFSMFRMKGRPSPRDLTLLAVGLPYVDIQWNSLIAAVVENISLGDCLELIRRAPLLETLALKAINAYPSIFTIINTSITRVHLRSIELSRIQDDDTVGVILNSLRLPSLENWIYSESAFPMEKVEPFLGYFSSRLTMFKFSVDEALDHRIIEFLGRLSSLESLELRIIPPCLTDKLLDLLYVAAQSPQFLPRLKSIQFRLRHGKFPWDSLHQISTVPRWRSLKVEVAHDHLFDISYQSLRRLLELVDGGFDVSIFSHGVVVVIEELRELYGL